jgi:hypothetical protein
MRRSGLVALPLACAVLAAGAVSPAGAQTSPLTVTFVALNGSAVAGSATLTGQTDGSTKIDVRLTPATGDHPMHIHEGTCANASPAPWYALSNVQGGASTTDVSLTLADLTRAPRSILVRQSAQALDTVVACADIVVAAGAVQVAGAQTAGAPAPAAPDVAVLPTGGEPDVSVIRPIVAFALFALGCLGLFHLRRPSRGGT